MTGRLAVRARETRERGKEMTLLERIDQELADWRRYRDAVVNGETISDDMRRVGQGSLKVAALYGRAGATIANQYNNLLTGARMAGLSGPAFAPIVQDIAASLGLSGATRQAIEGNDGASNAPVE